MPCQGNLTNTQGNPKEFTEKTQDCPEREDLTMIWALTNLLSRGYP